MSKLSDYDLKWVKTDLGMATFLWLLTNVDQTDEIAVIKARKISNETYELELISEEMGITVDRGDIMLNQWNCKIVAEKNLKNEIKGIKKFITDDIIKAMEY